MQAARDTIFALASGRPPAAISVLRISGPQAHKGALQLVRTLPLPRTTALRALRHPLTGELLDEALVLRFDAPASSTGEDVIELHCHGGRAVVDAILAALSTIADWRMAQPGEFTRRAFENGRIDLTEAEGLADLIEAETESQRKAALALADGGLRKQIARWQETLLGLSAAAERAIDYDEDDHDFDPVLARHCRELAEELGAWLERPTIEPLRDGVRVVIAGPPNSGKSSLINAILGEERSIVSDVPGTTRDHIEVPLSLDGVPIRLTDTAGLRATNDEVEAIGVRRAAELMEAADVLLWLGEPDAVPTTHPRLLLVHAKMDLPGREDAPEGSLGVSAVTHAGLGDLLCQAGVAARSVLPGEEQVVLNRRQFRLLAQAEKTLAAASQCDDLVILAEGLRSARSAFDQVTWRAGLEDVLDSLFNRFCLGK